MFIKISMDPLPSFRSKTSMCLSNHHLVVAVSLLKDDHPERKVIRKSNLLLMVKRNRAVAQVEVYKTVQQKNLGNFTCQPAWGAPKMGMVLPTDKD